MPLRPCLTCGTLTTGTRCNAHAHLTTGTRGSTRTWRQTRTAILERDNYTCHCGNPATHVDHITRKRHGGTDDPHNLRATCAHCNLTRG
jgi:5-methylcytosine-specific restriction endonuclease McrA